MAEFVLKAKTALNRDMPFVEQWEGFSCEEISGQRVWWGGVARNCAEPFAKTVKKHFGCEVPSSGRFCDGGLKGETVRLLSAGERQYFITSKSGSLAPAFAKVIYLTDQSDGWNGVLVEGKQARTVLAKLCGIDTHPLVFPAGSAARSPFEGMHALIACEDVANGRYSVHFQRSSARSFIDHLCHAAASACGPAKSGGH